MTEDFFAKEIALSASLDELIQRERIRRRCDRKIFAQHGAELGFPPCEVRVEQMRDHWAEEKPPEFEGAIETV